jgi:1-deoxy-D-xylulose-5-phosphate reductoisomerase
MSNPYIETMKPTNSPDRTFTILGATGSIGTQLLEILEQTPSLGKVRVLTANRRAQCLAELANTHRPEIVVLCEPAQRAELEAALTYKPTVLVGEEALEDASLYDSDLVINALVGFSGFMPTVRAIRAGKTVVLSCRGGMAFTRAPRRFFTHSSC